MFYFPFCDIKFAANILQSFEKKNAPQLINLVLEGSMTLSCGKSLVAPVVPPLVLLLHIVDSCYRLWFFSTRDFHINLGVYS
jgi:hypothetical protein